MSHRPGLAAGGTIPAPTSAPSPSTPGFVYSQLGSHPSPSAPSSSSTTTTAAAAPATAGPSKLMPRLAPRLSTDSRCSLITEPLPQGCKVRWERWAAREDADEQGTDISAPPANASSHSTRPDLLAAIRAARTLSRLEAEQRDTSHLTPSSSSKGKARQLESPRLIQRLLSGALFHIEMRSGRAADSSSDAKAAPTSAASSSRPTRRATAIWRFIVSWDETAAAGIGSAAPTPRPGGGATQKDGTSTPVAAGTPAPAATTLPPPASANSAASSDPPDLVTARRTLDAALAPLQHSEGSYLLSSLWPAFSSSSPAQTASFSRVETIRLGGEHRKQHIRFLAALEQRCADEWLRAVLADEREAAERTKTEPAQESHDTDMKDPTAADGEAEEGEVQASSSTSTNKAQPSLRFTRSHLGLGSSVLLLPQARSSPLPSFLRLKTGSGRSELLLVSLQVHTTDRSLVVQVRPRAAGLGCLPADGEMLKPGTPLVLAPMRTEAVFCEAASALGADSDEVRSAKEAVLRSLDETCGAAPPADDWIIAAHRDGTGAFLWPRSLAFLDLDAGAHAPHARMAGLSTPRPYRAGPPTTMRQAKRHALQLAADTSELIRQIQPRPQQPPSSAAPNVVDEIAPGVSRLIELAALTPQPSRPPSEQVDADDDDDEEAAMSAFDDDASVAEVSPPAPQRKEEKVEPDATKGEESASAPVTSTAATEPPTRQPSPQPAAAVKERSSDMDLWGDLGFDDGGDLGGGGTAGRGQGKMGRDDDDGMYGGLVTDADFSFFDDDDDEEVQEAAPAGPVAELSSADAMDVDGQGATTLAAEPTTQPAPSTSSANAAAAINTTADTPRSSGLGGAYASTLGDPPSLPGLTDGASASSPAVGGVASKTPRTPWSPPQELGDQHIVVEGEGPYSHFGDAQGAGGDVDERERERLRPFANQSPDPLAPRDANVGDGRHDPAHAHATPTNKRYTQTMRDLASKYESGKFAVPMQGGVKGRNAVAKGDEGKADEMTWTSWTSRARASARAGRDATANGERPHRSGPGRMLKARLLDRVRGVGIGGKLGLDDGAASDIDSGAPTVDEEMSSGDESGGDGAGDEDDEGEGGDEAPGDDDLGAEDDDDDDDDDDEAKALAKMAARHAELLQTAAQLIDDPASWNDVVGSDHAPPPTAPTPRESPPYLDNFLELLASNPNMWWILCGGSEADAASGAWPLSQSMSSLETRDVLLGAEKLKGCPTSLDHLGDGTQVSVLEPPTFLVGCQGAVAKAAPTTLRFWDKLPLSAVSGPRHITPFVLHSTEAGMDLSDKIYQWLERLSRSFETLGLGSHRTPPGALLGIESDPSHGLATSIQELAADPEVWDDTIQSVFSRMRPFLGPEKHVVLYVIGEPIWPQPFRALLKLQDGLKAYVKRKVGLSGDHLVLRLVPIVALTSANVTWASRLRPWHDLRLDALTLYESCRLHSTTARTNKRPRFDMSADVSHPVRLPAFTLAPRNETPSASFALRWPGKQSGVLERGMLLHVAYEALDDGTSTGKISASIIDERGQDYAASAWPRSVGIKEDVESVWRFVADFASRAAVDWSVSVCRRGRFCVGELEAWAHICSEDSFRLSGIVWDLTLLRVDNFEPLALSAASGSSSPAKPPTPIGSEPVLLDASTCDFAVFPTERLVVPAACSVEADDDGDASLTADLLALRTSMLVRIPRGSDMTTRLAEREGGEGETREAKAVMFKPPPASSPHVTWIHVLQVHSTDVDTDEAVLMQLGMAAGGQPGTAASKSTRAPSTPTLDARVRRITTSFHELSTLARERCGFTCHLPWHLAMLDVTRRCLPSFNDSV